MAWLNDNLIDDKCIGFIYLIRENETGRFYVGRKNLTCYKTIKGKKVFKESNWKNYWGSNKDFSDYVKEKGKENFERIILEVCYTKIQMTYYELKHQILENWESELCFNSNLLGKFYKCKIIHKCENNNSQM